MATLKSIVRAVRPARRPPTPKRKPARLTSEVARFVAHGARKPRRRS